MSIIVDNPDNDPFLAQWNAFYSTVDDVAVTLGLIPVKGSVDSVVVRMPLTKHISQPAGMFSAPALFGLADISATWLAMQQVDKGVFPLAVGSSINVVSNTRSGDAIATSRVVRAGSTIIVTDTEIHSESGEILAKVTTTYSVPRPRSS